MKLKNEKNIEYEFFDVTADVGFKSYGTTLEEAYENASKAMFNVISNTDNVEAEISKNIEITSEDEVSLLYDYLDELLFLSETELLLFSSFNITIEKEQNKMKLNAHVKGEYMDWDKHQRGSEVKAVTYHLMTVKKEEKYITQVILDL